MFVYLGVSINPFRASLRIYKVHERAIVMPNKNLLDIGSHVKTPAHTDYWDFEKPQRDSSRENLQYFGISLLYGLHKTQEMALKIASGAGVTTQLNWACTPNEFLWFTLGSILS